MAARRTSLPLTLGLAVLALATGAGEACGQTTGVLQAVVTVVDVAPGAAALQQVRAALGHPLPFGFGGGRPDLPTPAVEVSTPGDTKRPGEGAARPLVVTVIYLR
jgi:hypothetical protein